MVTRCPYCGAPPRRILTIAEPDLPAVIDGDGTVYRERVPSSRDWTGPFCCPLAGQAWTLGERW